MFQRYYQLPRAVHILCLGSFVNRAATFMVLFLTMYLTKHRGFSIEFASLAMGLYGLGAIFAAATGGHFADQFGRRGVMLFALSGGAVCVASFGYLTSKPAILGFIVLTAMIGEMYRPAASAMIADLCGPDQRPHAFSLMYVAINLGFAVGAFVGGPIAEFSFKLLYWCDATTSLSYAAIILLATRETLHHVHAPPAGNDSAPPIPRVGIGEAARHIARDGTFLVFCVANLLLALVIMQSFTTLPLYLEQRGFTESQYGKIIGVNGLLIVLFQIPLTTWLGRFDRARLIVIATLFAAVGFGLTGVATSVSFYILTVIIWTIGEMIQSPLMPAITTDLAPPAMRARYFGLIGVCFSGGNMIGGPIGGMLLARFGGEFVWAAAFGVALLSALLYASLFRKISKPPAPVV